MKTIKFVFLVTVACFASILPTIAKAAHTGNDSIKVIRDLRYAARPDSIGKDTSSDRLLDLHLPVAGKPGKLPVIILIHGGGFSGGDKKSTDALSVALSKYGYAVVNINYRLQLKRKKVAGASASANMAAGLPESGFHPALRNAVTIASEDAQLALKWVKENAGQYQFDLKKVAMGGGSAGAMTALYTTYASRQKVLPVKAVINLWGGLEDVNNIQKGSAPLLTFHGDQDKLINVSFAKAIQSKKQDEGDNLSELYVMEGKGHARYDYILKEKVPQIAAFLKKVFSL
jgi:para-nitrobenzyl esterase